ncbi:MAG: hypothetical protein ACREIV_11165, partial [Planctomycetaceae bacterium]
MKKRSSDQPTVPRFRSSKEQEPRGRQETKRDEAMNRIRSAILPLAILVGCSTACEGVGGHRFVPDVQRELDDAESVAASWIATARGDSGIDATTAIASGYLERLRLGLGSPFR